MLVKMQHSVRRGCQGYCLSLSDGFSASQLLGVSGGFSASRLVRWLLGFSACPAAPVASRLARRLLGFSACPAAPRLRGFSPCPVASRLLGFSAGPVASRLLGLSGGFSASRLLGLCRASRLLVAFLGPFCPCFATKAENRQGSTQHAGRTKEGNGRGEESTQEPQTLARRWASSAKTTAARKLKQESTGEEQTHS